MPGQEVEGAELKDSGRETQDPETQNNPDEGPTMTGGGAEPGGNSMDHWSTSQPNTDATKPETMPKALGGTGGTPDVKEKSNPA